MSTPWRRFFVLYSIQFLQLLDFISITPSGALFVKNGQLQSSSISFSLTAYSIAAMLGSLTIAQFKMFQPKRLLLVLLILFGISQMLLLFQITDFLFISSRVIGGLTGGLMGSLAYSQLSQIEEGKNTGLWNGRIQTAQSLVSMAGIPLCLLVITSFGSSSYFATMTLYCSLVTIILLKSNFIQRNSSQSSTQDERTNWFKHADIIFSGFICYFAAFLFMSHMPNFLINARQVDTTSLSLAYCLSGTLTLIVSGKIGRFAEGRNVKTLLLICSLLICLPQFIFQIESIPVHILLYLAMPIYLMISTARAIYQRGIILEKKNEDSISMHLINNIAIRAGILGSGIALGFLSLNRDITTLFHEANTLSLICSLTLICALGCLFLFERGKRLGIK